MKSNQQFFAILLRTSLLLKPLKLDGCKVSEKAPKNAQARDIFSKV
jgi:hypothetical protein